MNSQEWERMAEDYDGWRQLVKRAEQTKWCDPHPERTMRKEGDQCLEQTTCCLQVSCVNVGPLAAFVHFITE